MKNLKYYPFKRNKYFYGKLLSVEDFITEQKYMNDKRRLINRCLYGTGVVCGLNVVAVDDNTISIEPGFAIDYTGREIVVDVPVIKKLEMIDGYNEAMAENGNAYLCIEYDEKEEEPVHNIASAVNGGNEYNKYTEGFHFYLDSEEPEENELTVTRFMEKRAVIYKGNGISITHVLPKFAEAGREFDMKIIVEKEGQQEKVAFEYRLDVSFAAVCDDDDTVRFDESSFNKSDHYEIIKKMRAMGVSDTYASVRLQKDSFNLRIGGRTIKEHTTGDKTAEFKVVTIPAEYAAFHNFYDTAFEDMVINPYSEKIYLAGIRLLKAGDNILIDSIHTVPFGQYVNSPIAARLRDKRISQETEAAGKNNKQENSIVVNEGDISFSSSGSVVIDMGFGGSLGQRFYSEEITHGLGLGPVNISLGKVQAMDENVMVFGEQEVFSVGSGEIDAAIAAKADISKGTFVIGLRCNRPTEARQVCIHWTAVKDIRHFKSDSEKHVMNIKPDMKNIKVCSTCLLQAVIDNTPENRIIWQVREKDGGMIDSNGLYTAPNREGVYELTAESMDYPELKASAFIVVRR